MKEGKIGHEQPETFPPFIKKGGIKCTTKILSSNNKYMFKMR